MHYVLCAVYDYNLSDLFVKPRRPQFVARNIEHILKDLMLKNRYVNETIPCIDSNYDDMFCPERL